MMELEHETIERKARHFVRWYQTTEQRLTQLNEIGNWAAHFNPQWKVKNMIHNAKDIFAALGRQNAGYLVMGGFAAIMYGVPRFTNDVVLFIEGTDKNIERVVNAFIELGSSQAQIFKTMNSTIVTFIEFDDLPIKTDVMVKVPGLEWESAWQNRVEQCYQEQPFFAMSRADLITAKRTAGRWQDLEDVKALEAVSDE
ncbi:hypothetical protein KFU94_17145 [Chloroflexi bacterium TSY]|nr:hypothetical protein [Chloroflexi bacterium TSY]